MACHGSVGSNGGAGGIISTISSVIHNAIGSLIYPSSISEALKISNPNYYTGEPKWRRNCQRCVFAYEMNRRGFDVEAKPRILDGFDSLPKMDHPKGWSHVMKGATLLTPSPDGQNVKKSIESQMKSWGDGARAVVRVRWDTGKGHVFVAEQMGGKTYFVDPQSGKKSCGHYFSKIIGSETRLMRMDNLEPTELIAECVKAREQ